MRYAPSILLAPLLALMAALSVAATASEPADPAADSKAIRQLATDWESAWNRRDAAALAAILAEDVDFLSVLGPNGWGKGRKAFQEAHASMLQTYFAESTWTAREIYVRYLRADIAIAHVLWSTTGDKVRHVKHGAPRQGIFTWVVEKQNGRWLVVASQNTESMPYLQGQ